MKIFFLAVYFVYRSDPPFTYSVIANATNPIMAARPFSFSAPAEKNPPDFDSAEIPWNMGTNDAAEKRAVEKMNQLKDALSPNCWARGAPVDSSTPIAVTNPSIANRPLIVSGAGPEKAKMSPNLVLA